MSSVEPQTFHQDELDPDDAPRLSAVWRAVLAILEEMAPVGLVLEGTPKRYWATAATYQDAISLEAAADLNRGRHDFRFGPTKNADKLIATLSGQVRAAGLA